MVDNRKPKFKVHGIQILLTSLELTHFNREITLTPNCYDDLLLRPLKFIR